MINKKHIITFGVFAVLLILAYVTMYASKPKNDQNSINQSGANQVGEPVINNQEQEKLTDGETKQESKKMTDIKEFSYEVLKEGTGIAAVANKTVTVDYKGMFLDGKIFDQGTFPFTLGVGQVVQGFDKGVLGMKVGETRKIYIPSDMGYGARGAGAAIPPNTDLIFEVTLKSIQ